ASPSVERVLGYAPVELLERNAFDLVHPEDIALVAEALARTIQRPNVPQSAEFRFRHHDGSWRVLEAVGQARLDHSGSAQLIVNARDVTQRRRQERALRESKERLRTVIAGAPPVLFAFDQNGAFTMAEGRGPGAAERVTGVIGVGTDVTGRQRAEEALRRSEESSRAVVENASYGIYRSTPEGKFLAANPAVVRLLGYASDAELLGVDLARDVYAD